MALKTVQISISRHGSKIRRYVDVHQLALDPFFSQKEGLSGFFLAIKADDIIHVKNVLQKYQRH